MPSDKMFFNPKKAEDTARRLRKALPDWQVEVEVLSVYRARLTLTHGADSYTVLQTGKVIYVHGATDLIGQLTDSSSAEEIADALTALAKKGGNSRARSETPDLKALVAASGGKLKTDEGDLYFSGKDVLVYGTALTDGKIRLGVKASPEVCAQIISAIFHTI